MKTALHLAGPDELERCLAFIADFHAEAGIEQDAETRENAVRPLLSGSPHGAIYLIGLARAPVGYVALSFGWSIEFGGLDGFVDELYIRPAVRRRGMASEVLLNLPNALAEVGLRALHLEVGTQNEAAARVYARCGFVKRAGYHLMTRTLW